MRINIIFHSVSGNLYIVSKTFQEKMIEKGLDARLYRVNDEDLHIEAAKRNEVNEYLEEIMEIPVINIEKLEKADAIVIGSISLFGSPSAEMKAFLDSTWPLYEKQSLKGKTFYGFSSSSVSYEDGKNTIQCLYTWARMQGLEFLPYASYVHKDGNIMPNRPGEGLSEVATYLADNISSFTNFS